MNILVLCTGNSARSILLEALLNHLGKSRVTAFSAGSQPTGKVNAHAIEVLTRHGHDTRGIRSKSWDEFGGASAPRMDAVITVCGSAAGETCPMWPGAPVRAHWGVEDPAAAEPEAQPAAFQAAYRQLSAKAERLFALPFEEMSHEDLQAVFDRMKSERRKIAERYRSAGLAESAVIRSRADRELRGRGGDRARGRGRRPAGGG